MTPALVVANAESAVRDWLREQPAVVAVVGRRIFIGVPPEMSSRESSYPLVGVHRLPSALELYLPVDRASLQLDCWGPQKSQRTAFEAASVIASALWNQPSNTVLDAHTRALGVYDVTVNWLPDPVSDRPRYIVTATVCLITSS